VQHVAYVKVYVVDLRLGVNLKSQVQLANLTLGQFKFRNYRAAMQAAGCAVAVECKTVDSIFELFTFIAAEQQQQQHTWEHSALHHLRSFISAIDEASPKQKKTLLDSLLARDETFVGHEMLK